MIILRKIHAPTPRLLPNWYVRDRQLKYKAKENIYHFCPYFFFTVNKSNKFSTLPISNLHFEA